MTEYSVRFMAPQVCRDCVLGYRIEADSKWEAADQARRIAMTEHPETRLILLAVTPQGEAA